MSKGREWIPVLRRNKTMMMRVNVEPIIMCKDTAISCLYRGLGWKEKTELVSLKKKDIKKCLKRQAQYLSYYDYFEDAPCDRENLIEDNKNYEYTWNLEVWDACDFLITKHFPEFDIND